MGKEAVLSIPSPHSILMLPLTVSEPLRGLPYAGRPTLPTVHLVHHIFALQLVLGWLQAIRNLLCSDTGFVKTTFNQPHDKIIVLYVYACLHHHGHIDLDPCHIILCL